MALPEITHLQFVVLAALVEGEQTGRYLREKLEDVGERKSGPAFYQLMARMEDAALVQGHYDQKIVEGQIIKERRYQVTAAGEAAFRYTCEFYQQRAALLRGDVANA